MNRLQTVGLLLMAGLVAWTGSPARAEADPVGNGFTYQGRLVNAGAPANGLFDLRFSVFDKDVNGVLVAGPLCFDGVPVTDGVFTVMLDYGKVFEGDKSWLEIEVRPDAVGSCSDGAGFTRLSPRQELTAAPYASFAGGPWAASSDGVSFVAANVEIGQNKVVGMNPPDGFAYDGKNMGHYSLGWFTDSWDGLGATAWLSAYAGIKFFCEGRPVLSIPRYGYVGIGTTTPLNPLSVVGGADFTGKVGLGTAAPQAKLDVRGDIRLGASGEYWAVAAGENLRVVRGRVGPGGEIPPGSSGFVISHSGVGEYKITVTPTMDTGVAAITITPNAPGPRIATFMTLPPNTIVINTATVQGTLVDCAFSFTVIGPR